MSPWIGNGIFIVSVIASILIRVPHDKVSQETKIVETRKGLIENLLLLLVMLGLFLLPILSFTPALGFASYAPHPLAVAFGTILMGTSLWVFFRSHADLGKNWSKTLEIRDGHSLVTTGIYKTIRHPMYSAIFLLAIGQVFLLSNWIAGPAMLIAFSLMFFSRLQSEEQMMLDKFGSEYDAYRKRSKRIVPGVW